jgi:LytS/YehU family sensor histidine kinase
MLRYQLNPHFLFNALNSIYGLVYPHSRPAGDLVRRLADFCHSTLTRTDDQWHSLADECAMLRTYLDIEQARWRERLVVEFNVDPAAGATRLPAFILLPVVDNAIKHGGATSPGVLTVRLTAQRAADGAIQIEVGNSGTWLAASDPRPTSSTGIGMENLRARLERCFPAAHALEVVSAEGWVCVKLRLGAPATAIENPK